MTWVKVPDDALEDPAIAEVAPEAVVAYLRALGWSNRWARDGRVPLSIAGEGVETWADANLAEVHRDYVQLVWLLEHQPKADEIKESRRLAAERQERHRRHMAGDHSKCDPKRCRYLITRDKTRDKTRDTTPPPSRPDPSLPEGRGEGTGNGEAGSYAPVAVPEKDELAKRRDMAREIRNASHDSLRKRYQRTFDREFGHLYGRQVAS